MSRTSIVALVLFVAGLGYLLSLGVGGTRKLQSSVYQYIAPFFEFWRRFAKANHFRAEQLEIA